MPESELGSSSEERAESSTQLSSDDESHDSGAAAADAASEPGAAGDEAARAVPSAAAGQLRRPPHQQTPPAERHFAVGDAVAVRRYGGATVVAGPPADPADPQAGRVLVQYAADGKTYWARPATLRPVAAKPPARVLVAETTKHYRSAAMRFAHAGDVALEVGCHEGVTTHILHQRCMWVLGIDLHSDPVERARARFPDVRFERLDGFDVGTLRARSPTGRFDKIFLDIGGIAQLHTVMGLLGLYFRCFRGATLVVKSRYLKGLLGHAAVYVPPGEQLGQQQRDERQRQHGEQQRQQREQQRKQGEQRNGGAAGEGQQRQGRSGQREGAPAGNARSAGGSEPR